MAERRGWWRSSRSFFLLERELTWKLEWECWDLEIDPKSKHEAERRPFLREFEEGWR